jgi:hypothetical protein
MSPPMTPQDFMNMIGGIALSVLGWFAREMWQAMSDLKTDLAKLREDIPKTYVPKDEYRDDVKHMNEMLGKIFDKLDKKVDR